MVEPLGRRSYRENVEKGTELAKVGNESEVFQNELKCREVVPAPAVH